uniref:NERD domain-containing protein n=1 Tax=Quercus lobata TaxID=97700 RepID=A0A7N2MJ05_QUELO
MWVEIFCGLIIYKLFKCFFYDDDVLDLESSDFTALFSVADRLEKLYGGKVYVGLRIPDADTGSRQNIDMVLVNKGEAVVISVKNISGFVSVNSDGSWVCEGGSKHKAERFPDPVAETKKQASILESYLEQRGVALPEGYFSCKVVLPNPKFCTIQSSAFPSEVITYDQWVQLKPEPKSMFSGWIKGAFRSGKKEMQESIHQKLNFTLSTAPMWDRFVFINNLIHLQHTNMIIPFPRIGHLVKEFGIVISFLDAKHLRLLSPRDFFQREKIRTDSARFASTRLDSCRIGFDSRRTGLIWPESGHIGSYRPATDMVDTAETGRNWTKQAEIGLENRRRGRNSDLRYFTAIGIRAMATIPPNTRSTTNDDRLAALEVSTHSLKQQADAQKEEFAGMKGALEALIDAVAKMSRATEDRGTRVDEEQNSSGRDNGSINRHHEYGEGSRGTQQGSLQTRFSRLDFPCFNGENPTRWIYKAEQFFHYKKTEANEKVVLASFHL